MGKHSFCGIQWIMFCFISLFTLNNASPSSLFQGSPYSGAVHRHRNKNWCAFIVQKNVTCAVQGGVGGFEEPRVAPCPPHQPNCEQQVMYHTRFRPTYRIAYKTVTEIEWRCCPGFQGPDCRELKGSPNRSPLNRQTILEPQNDRQARPDVSIYPQRPERRDIPYHDVRRTGVDKARLLEGEVQKLSQAVQDLQAAMAGMSENLRTNLQEDTSKMLTTLLNNMRPPDSARSGGTEESPGLLLDGHLAVRGHVDEQRGMEEVMARLDGLTDALKSKDEALEELRGTVSGQGDQIRMLMDTAQGPPIGGYSADLDVLQLYIDRKFDKLKKEVTDNIEEKMIRFKNTCNERMTSVESLCQEEHKNIYSTLTELMDAKHDDLKREISTLRLDISVADGPIPFNRDSSLLLRQDDDQNDLRREIQRVADAHRLLNARMDNELEHLSMLQLEDVFGPRIEELEDRMNVTERNAELHCLFVEEKLTKTISDEVTALRQLMEDRLNGMEDQFTTMLVEMSNNSFPGAFSDSMDTLQNEINSNKFLIQTLDDKINAVGEICQTKDCKPGLGGLDGILRDVRRCKNELEVLGSDVAQNTDKIKQLELSMDGLSVQNQGLVRDTQVLKNKFNTSSDIVDNLSSSVVQLKDSMNKYAHDYESLNATCCRQGQAGEGLSPAQGTKVHLDPSNQVHEHQIEELKSRLVRLQAQMIAEVSRCNDSTGRMNEKVADLNGRVSKLEEICGNDDGVSRSVPGVREKPTLGFSDPVRQLNSTVKAHTLDIRNLQSSLHNVQTQLSSLAKHILTGASTEDQVPLKPQRPATPSIQIPIRQTPRQPPRQPQINQIHIVPQRVPVQPRQPTVAQQPVITQHHQQQPGQPRHPQQPGLLPRQPSSPLFPSQPQMPRRPLVETGEAGPPGYQRRVTVRRDEESKASQKPVTGFAGAPGYPPVSPVAFKTNPFAVSHMPYKRTPHIPLVTPVAAQSHAPDDPLSFSAGLTNQPFSGDFSVVRFNRVLVNDGGHYNPETGIFTVPMDGRYLVTAVLAAQRGDRVEAVLSVSNRSVQRLDTAGYGQGERTSSGTDKDKCLCGGSASFSIVLPLRKGDRVGVVRTAGKLAVSESSEILSTFSAIFLYSPQASR